MFTSSVVALDISAYVCSVDRLSVDEPGYEWRGNAPGETLEDGALILRHVSVLRRHVTHPVRHSCQSITVKRECKIWRGYGYLPSPNHTHFQELLQQNVVQKNLLTVQCSNVQFVFRRRIFCFMYAIFLLLLL